MDGSYIVWMFDVDSLTPNSGSSLLCTLATLCTISMICPSYVIYVKCPDRFLVLPRVRTLHESNNCTGARS